MVALRKNFAGQKEGPAQVSKSFEEILDNSAGHNSSEEEEEDEEEDSLHDKVQAEHMKEIKKKKEAEENFASSQMSIWENTEIEIPATSWVKLGGHIGPNEEHTERGEACCLLHKRKFYTFLGQVGHRNVDCSLLEYQNLFFCLII